MCPKGACCSVWGMWLICCLLPLATYCHTHYHLHPFHFMFFKFKNLVAKQHPTTIVAKLYSTSQTVISCETLLLMVPVCLFSTYQVFLQFIPTLSGTSLTYQLVLPLHTSLHTSLTYQLTLVLLLHTNSLWYFSYIPTLSGTSLPYSHHRMV